MAEEGREKRERQSERETSVEGTKAAEDRNTQAFSSRCSYGDSMEQLKVVPEFQWCLVRSS